MKFTGISKFIPIIHIIFWVGVFLISTTTMNRINSGTITMGVANVFLYGIIAYLNLLIYLPYLFKRKKYTLYIVVSIASIVILTIIRIRLLIELVGTPGDRGPSLQFATYPIIGFFLISTTVWFISNWLESSRREVELVNWQLDSELKFLKLQLNPHFLFNTLNNIYSLTLLKDENASHAVMKLSHMMRHMIHHSQDKFIPLVREVDFIDNFIELQKIKIDYETDIKFTKSGIQESHQIAPLIFLAFLENSFKHGQQNAIDIKLYIEGNFLHFSILNKIPEQPSTQVEKSGVGLANVKKRLELIYPNKHELIINSEDNLFHVELNVDLS